jgi:uncharacterized protein YraI
MIRLQRWPIFLLLVLCLSLGAVTIAQGQDSGTTVSPLNVRTRPGTESEVITLVPDRVPVIIEGRNSIGNWILIHTQDNGIRGWVATRFVVFDDGVNLDLIPVTNEWLTAAPAPVVTPENGGEVPVAENNTQPLPPPPAGTAAGQTITTLNMRVGPGTGYDKVNQAPQGADIIIEGRNALGDWLLVRTPDNTARGWVATRFVRVGAGVILNNQPILDEIVGEQPEGVEEVPNIVLPTGNLEEMYARLDSTPVLHNMVNSRVIEIFDRGQEMGNNPRVFMKVGDSLTALEVFMIGFGVGGKYNLGPYGHLQATIDFFSVPPRAGATTSFTNQSIAAQRGFVSAAVFDGAWVNPAVCSEAPLYCEYGQIKPSVAIIMFGSQDMQVVGAYGFQANMYRMVDDLVKRGVIPVLTTVPGHPNFHWEDAIVFNNIILNISRDYNVPVINLWKVTVPMPNSGVRHDDLIHLSHGENMFTFANGEEATYGANARNLLTLQALDELRRNVLLR